MIGSSFLGAVFPAGSRTEWDISTGFRVGHRAAEGSAAATGLPIMNLFPNSER